MYNRMKVIKRSGKSERVSFDKILNRIKSLCSSEEFSNKLNIDETILAQKVVQEIYDGVKTSELDDLSAQNAMSLYSTHLDFKILAGRITVSNLHKNTLNNFSDKINLMYNHISNGERKPLIAEYLYKFVQQNKDLIDNSMDYNKDYNYDFLDSKHLKKHIYIKLIIKLLKDLKICL